MNILPLLPDGPAESTVAWQGARAVSRGEFFGEVLALARRLPQTSSVLNLCMDRYWFAVAFFAAISRNIVSLFPNSSAKGHLASLCADAPDVVCLHEGSVPPISRVACLRVDAGGPCAPGNFRDLPVIPFDQQVACVFTSGSSGAPQPHFKSFGRSCLSARAEAERIWPFTGGPCAVLGTVPVGHMFGLESTILLPVLGGGQLCGRTPFFPADIAGALAEMESPRLLVTTPFHLRMLLEADIEIPQVACLLSATAPLPLELARKAEDRTGAPMLDLYGSTETGQLATRRPTAGTDWQPFPGIVLRQDGDGVIAEGGHLERPQRLNDAVELVSPSRFRLIDRNANMINVAGKRSSLSFLNHSLASVPGVRDGVFCLPVPAAGGDVTRLAAFVVAPGLTATDILDGLRPYLDPVFLPRPIVFLNALDRDGNGKIAASTLAGLMAAHFNPGG